jgi:hypothetical protein
VKIQLLSDLHLETECFQPEPAAGAELLVLAGDIDATWKAFTRFAGWPVPVILVPGNHEFDGREMRTAVQDLRRLCQACGIQLLYREACLLTDSQGRRIRLLGTTRWSDFDVFGPAQRERALRAATFFQRRMAATRDGAPFDALAVREEGQACRAWLSEQLQAPGTAADATVVVTHFAPSLRSADPRYGRQPGTASFCNADDDLIAMTNLWLHGHVHCRHDYRVPRAGLPPARVVCQARGLDAKGESTGHQPCQIIDI